jgi:predicted aminopeptidase
VPGLRRILTDAGGDLPIFYARVRELAGRPAEARRAELCGRHE